MSSTATRTRTSAARCRSRSTTASKELQPKFPGQFILVETPLAERPWGSYDKDSVEDIIVLQERLEASPTDIRRYEEENQNRPEIIEIMRAQEQERQQEEITVEA